MGEYTSDYQIGAIADSRDRRGWFLGHFMPEESLQHSEVVEMAVMDLPLIDASRPHYHRLGTEVTYVIRGSLRLIVGHGDSRTECDLTQGQFIIVPPMTPLQNPANEEGTQVFVVKFPSVPGDKYFVES